MLSQVAERMGWAGAFSYRSAADVFREHATLSGFENGGSRLFDISGLARLGDEDYDALTPVQWPVRSPASGTERLFGDGAFAFPSGRARLVAISSGRLANAASKEWPFVLNTGRVRDQWHTMTRTGMSPRPGGARGRAVRGSAPKDAAALGLEQAMLRASRRARVRSSARHGE
jgi:assimilatory nitrate reductase catalytic subunit